MNWDAVKFDWNQARAFMATAEEGSLSAAARVLGQTQPTLGRQVTALEEELGVALFERAGRSLVLTDTGRELLTHVRIMCDAAARISITASSKSQSIEGNIAISATDLASAYQVPGYLTILREIAPGITVDVITSNDLSDLQRREADIAIRHVRPEQPELTARLVKTAQARIYAATAYLDRHGRPQTIDDLGTAEWVGVGDNLRQIEEMSAQGINLSSEQFRHNSQNGVTYWELVKAGLGLALMVDDVAQLSPDVEDAFPGFKPVPVPVWLVTHKELHTSRRVRLVFDLLADAIARSDPNKNSTE